MDKRIRLGDLLLQHHMITQTQLDEILAIQKESGKRLGKLFVEKGILDEERLLSFLGEQLGLAFVDLDTYKVNRDTAKKLPEHVAKKNIALPIDYKENKVWVAIADPTDMIAYDEVSRHLKAPIQLVVSRENALLRIIDATFDQRDQLIRKLGEERLHFEHTQELQGIESDVSEAPVNRLIHSLLEEALYLRASDIHLEPGDNFLRLRFRIDGILEEQKLKGSSIIHPLVSRLKLMAKVDISEKRLPQEGRFEYQVKDKLIDVRLSTMPVKDGESVALRILDQSAGLLKLDQLGLPQKLYERIYHHCFRPHGMILVTGPTGSGKTTTLYAALSALNATELKIITAEDPIEYHLPDINQVQVNSQIELTFTKILKSALRQDPDIIMLGEIRDTESAQMALRSAMTGHLVFSTLHTNDAISATMRLIEMGVPSYLVAGALRAVIAQRLLRRVCQHCQTSYKPNLEEQAWLSELLKSDVAGMHFVKGEGCNHCNRTGYFGRIGIYEFLEINVEMADALRDKQSHQFVSAARNSPLYRTLTHWALDYACQGITTLEEVFKLAWRLEE